MMRLRQPASRAAELSALRRRLRAERASGVDQRRARAGGRGRARQARGRRGDRRRGVVRIVRGAPALAGRWLRRRCVLRRRDRRRLRRSRARCARRTPARARAICTRPPDATVTPAARFAAPTRARSRSSTARRGASTTCATRCAPSCTAAAGSMTSRPALAELDRAMQAFTAAHRARQDRDVLAPVIEAVRAAARRGRSSP